MTLSIDAKLVNWKTKAQERGEQVRRLKAEKQRQHDRAEKWKDKYYELKKKGLRKVKSHPYPLELIWLAVLMHISYNVSLRGVSRSLCKLGELYGLAIDYISPSTIRNWCLKFGLYCLEHSTICGKHVLILDESVEIDKAHLLVLLAVPIADSSPIQALGLKDVKVLDVKVQSSWKGEQIAERIKKLEDSGLEIAYGISDGGHTLKNALRRRSITWVSDCTHVMANKAKALFKDDDAFNGFIKRLNALRAKWIMSKHHFYVPPGLRAKSRFHQLFIVHRWARFILCNWDRIPTEAQLELAFVKESEGLVEVMEHFHFLIDTFARIFKHKGIQRVSMEEWQNEVADFLAAKTTTLDFRVSAFITAMNTYLTEQTSKFEGYEGEQILCCSDIIESLFGKYKYKGGAKIMTEDVLQIAAYPDAGELKKVKQAMEAISIGDVKAWKKENTTISKLVKLRKFRAKTAA